MAMPVLEYLSDIPLGGTYNDPHQPWGGAALAAGWSPEIIKQYCAETCDVQVAQLKLNKAGAN
jgi:hypothetical protein